MHKLAGFCRTIELFVDLNYGVHFSAAIVHTVERASGALACGGGGGGFPGRAVEAIDMQLARCEFAVARQKSFVGTIEPAKDALAFSLLRYFLGVYFSFRPSGFNLWKCSSFVSKGRL